MCNVFTNKNKMKECLFYIVLDHCNTNKFISLVKNMYIKLRLFYIL